jgi:hypothetical protein
MSEAEPNPFAGRDCPDCGVKKGQTHEYGCDVARCPNCGNQEISCDCDPDGAAGLDGGMARRRGVPGVRGGPQ